MSHVLLKLYNFGTFIILCCRDQGKKRPQHTYVSFSLRAEASGFHIPNGGKEMPVTELHGPVEKKKCPKKNVRNFHVAPEWEDDSWAWAFWIMIQMGHMWHHEKAPKVAIFPSDEAGMVPPKIFGTNYIRLSSGSSSPFLMSSLLFHVHANEKIKKKIFGFSFNILYCLCKLCLYKLRVVLDIQNYFSANFKSWITAVKPVLRVTAAMRDHLSWKTTVLAEGLYCSVVIKDHMAWETIYLWPVE